MLKKTFRVALLDSLPVLAGYLVLGFGFGVLIQRSGYPGWLAPLMSLVIYAGSLQYAAVGLITGCASLLTTALITFTVNARHLFYSLTMLEKYRDVGKAKPYLIFSLTDETFSLVSRETLPDGAARKPYYVILSLLNHSYWVVASALGALFGTLVQFNSRGIEFAMTALFVVIFLEQWLSTKRHLSALLGLGVTALCLFLFGSEYFLIPAMLSISVLLLLLRRWLDPEVTPDE